MIGEFPLMGQYEIYEGKMKCEVVVLGGLVVAVGLPSSFYLDLEPD